MISGLTGITTLEKNKETQRRRWYINIRKEEIFRRIVDKIVVTENNNQEHTLKIMFRQPYVGDKLIYNDPDNKSEGYSVKDGKRVKTLTTSLSKKSLKNTG